MKQKNKAAQKQNNGSLQYTLAFLFLIGVEIFVLSYPQDSGHWGKHSPSYYTPSATNPRKWSHRHKAFKLP